MADLGRQLADLLYGDQAPQTQEPERQKIARLLESDRLRRLAGIGEAAATFGTGLAASVPAGLAGLSQLIPTRGRAPDVNRAAQTVEDVQSALTYMPRTETGQRVLQRAAGPLEMLGAPAEYLGEKTLQATGSPGLATAANVLLDPVNFIGMPGSGKAAMAAGRAAMATPRVAAEMVGDLLMPKGTPMERQRGAIKMKGGNWLAGEVESAVDPLKTRTGGGMDQADALQEMRRVYPPETTNPDILRRQEPIMRSLEQGAALNKWIDKKLGGYIRNEMGTPEDPVRKLADQGIIHSQNVREFDVEYMSPSLKRHRRLAGFPEKGYASTDLGRAWEAMTDKGLMFSQAGDYQGSDAPGILSRNPWLEKVPGETPVYETASRFDTRELGFDHLIDELKNSINPASDLPARLRWKPEDLEKVTMEQAVKRVHDINEYRAAKKAEANEILARNPATVDFKTYETVPGTTEANKMGLAWKEIKAPEAPELPPGYSIQFANGSPYLADAQGNVVSYVDDEGQARKVIGKQALADALKYEGDVMGHCVGGYCNDVLSGQTKIYSLRDKKGEPHVTIEVRPNSRNGMEPNQFWQSNLVPESLLKKVDEAEKAGYFEDIGSFEDFISTSSEYKDYLKTLPPEIIQIKGKGNRAPKEEYLPFVQDFVRSGNWSRVGDIQNTGMRAASSVFNENELKKLRDLGETNIPAILSGADIQRLHNLITPEGQRLKYDAKGNIIGGEGQSGYKKGGSVRISDNPDTMRLELATGGAVKAAAKAATKAAKEVPPPLSRAAPKTKAEIEAIAERMAPQMLGEYVRKEPGSAVTVAGKTKKQFEREKELPVQLTGEAKTPEAVDIERLKGKAMMGILGDPSITGRELESVGDIRLGLSSPQHGGPLYGMGREDEAFWASGKGAAKKVQNLADEISKQYGTDVLGKYIMMGPEGLNYAQHFADANLQAIDLSKMTKRQIDGFNSLIRRGTPNSGPRPDFPGIEDKQGAYLWMAFDPEIRKHFNSLMQMNTVTEKFNLPSGQDIRFAITEPSLRDLERGVTGMSIGEMRPGAELTYSKHPTYEMDIPGKFLGSSKYPVPYELMFPDTVKAIRENPRQAPHEFGSLGMTGPRQIIDQQMIDEIKAYEERIKRLTGKKKGGAVKKQAGGAIKAAAKAVKPTAEQATKLAASRAEMVLRSRAMQELKDQFDDLPLGQQPQGWMSPERVQQKIDEIRRREATPEGGQIPLLKKGGQVKFTGNLDAMRLAVQKRK